MKMQSHFDNELFEFLVELQANNNREWFAEHKERYERHVKQPLLDFIEDFEPYLHSISKHFVADARANGGSMFRIYRDVRFSKDKSPYKTQAAVHFRHEAGKSAHAPGFYLHLAPDEVFAGVGLWRPDSAALAGIRQQIVDDPQGWDHAVQATGFAEEFELTGDSLKRPPKGFDPDHPNIEDLKRKDHVATVPFSEDEVTTAGFIESFADACRIASPYTEFLTTAVGLPY
ncbi:MAG: DUF2461 domain-containing protein [bacterium]|uniref:DUF2461 domain-containing protein n=1 Tax=Candidatus Poriferisocius sp. TaxID=3101276 RepID=UPI0023908FD1|nr:DUF2461 domain-containing protein [bacterium]